MVDSLDVCPTEDAIEVFLEHLIDPLLPKKSSVKDNPTPSQQESMAKQVCFSSFMMILLRRFSGDAVSLFGWFRGLLEMFRVFFVHVMAQVVIVRFLYVFLAC